MCYKIIRGYSAEDYIEINKDELEKANYCFLMKKDAIYSGGAVKGSEILAIQPDYHRAMGWNRGYKLQAEDYAELKERGIDRKMQLELEKAGDKVKYLMQTNQEHLIGKNVAIPELESLKVDEVRKLTEGIADKFKIK